MEGTTSRRIFELPSRQALTFLTSGIKTLGQHVVSALVKCTECWYSENAGMGTAIHDVKVLECWPRGSSKRFGTISLRRTDTGTSANIVIVGHSRIVRSVALSAYGARIVSASDDMSVRVWGAETSALFGAALKGHTDFLSSAVYIPGSERVASVSYDETLRIWEPKRAGAVRTAREQYSSFATCAAVSADGARSAVGYYDVTICMWDMERSRAVGKQLKGYTATEGSVAFSPDGTLLASRSGDRTGRL